MNKLLSELQKLAPNPGVSWGAIGALLRHMDIDEDEIAKAQARHPGREKIIWRGFRLLYPNAYLHGAPEPVYRHHCAELLDRVAQGFDTTLGTDAEVMMGLSAASLKSPLKHTAAVLYARLFRAILPDALVAEGTAQLSTWADDETVGRLLAELSKKCQSPERKLTKGR